MEVKVGQNVLFSEFVEFLSRNCNAPLVSCLCIQRLTAPYPFTLLYATLNLRQFICLSLMDKLPHTTSCFPKDRSTHRGASYGAADTQQFAVPVVTSPHLQPLRFSAWLQADLGQIFTNLLAAEQCFLKIAAGICLHHQMSKQLLNLGLSMLQFI